MATFEKCDVCGAQSPDENGLHISNHFTRVELKLRIQSDYTTYHVCDKCMIECELMKPPMKLMKRLRHLYLRHLFPKQWEKERESIPVTD